MANEVLSMNVLLYLRMQLMCVSDLQMTSQLFFTTQLKLYNKEIDAHQQWVAPCGGDIAAEQARYGARTCKLFQLTASILRKEIRNNSHEGFNDMYTLLASSRVLNR